MILGWINKNTWMAALVLGGAYSLCGLAGQTASDEIRIAIQGDIRGTNPGVTRDGNTDTVIHHVVEALVAYREDLTVAPQLAERIEVADNGATYRFALRRDVVFHNGAPMTARQVKWSWQRMLDPATHWRCRRWYDGTGSQGTKITAIETPDDYTVVFRLQQPSSAFLHRLANVQCVTAILHPDSVGPDGEWIAPVGTGPYTMDRWQRGEYIALKKFDRYASPSGPRDGYAGARKALAGRLRFMIVPEISIGVAGVMAGDIDIVPHIPLHMVPELQRHPDIHLSGQDLLYWTVLLIQTDDELLGNPLIRKAIAHALNPEQIALVSSFGKARANPSALPVMSPYYSPSHSQWWPYDPEKARQLLRQAGYRGEPIRIKTNRKYAYMFENAIAVQAMLTAVGIHAPLDVVDWATQLSDYFAGRFQLSSFGYSGRTHPALNYGTLLGSKRQNPAVQWQNAQALDLLNRAEHTFDRVQQQKIFARIHQLMIEDIPIIGLYNEHQVEAMRKEIHGFENWSIGRPRLWGVWKSDW